MDAGAPKAGKGTDESTFEVPATRGGHPSVRGPERRFWGWAVGLALGVMGLTGGQALLFWLNHGAWFARLDAGFRARLMIFLALAVVSLVVGLWFALRHLFRAYVFPTFRLEEDLEAMLAGAASGSAGASATGAGHLAGLEGMLGEVARRHAASEQETRQRLDAALAEAAGQQRSLESVLEAIGEGVVVTDSAGVVRHFNGAARRLMPEGDTIGRGRSILPVVGEPLWNYALESLRGQMAAGEPFPLAEFLLTAPSGADVRVRTVPLRDGAGGLDGVVVTIDDDPRAQRAMAAPVGDPAAAGAGHAGAIAGETPLSALRFVVFDTETTGLRPGDGDEIIAIGAVVVFGGAAHGDETFDRLVAPRRASSSAATRIHGLTAEALAGQPPIAEVLPAFARFASDAVLVAHNAAFDMAFLRKHGAELGVNFDQPVLDTMLLSAVVHPHQPSHALDALLPRYGIEARERHAALGDALMTAELLLRLMPELERRGINTLAEALAASRKTPLARVTF